MIQWHAPESQLGENKHDMINIKSSNIIFLGHEKISISYYYW